MDPLSKVKPGETYNQPVISETIMQEHQLQNLFEPIAAIIAALVAFAGGSIWVGKISARVTALENKEPEFSLQNCEKSQAACKVLQQTQFEHGNQELGEIKTLLGQTVSALQATNKSISDNHTEILKLIINSKTERQAAVDLITQTVREG